MIPLGTEMQQFKNLRRNLGREGGCQHWKEVRGKLVTLQDDDACVAKLSLGTYRDTKRSRHGTKN